MSDSRYISNNIKLGIYILSALVIILTSIDEGGIDKVNYSASLMVFCLTGVYDSLTGIIEIRQSKKRDMEYKVVYLVNLYTYVFSILLGIQSLVVIVRKTGVMEWYFAILLVAPYVVLLAYYTVKQLQEKG